MEEIDIATIKKKSFTGVLALVGRTFFVQVATFAATFLLTLYLTPTIFGIYYVVSAFIAFLSYFSDIGLAAALIQKKEFLTESDLVTTFTIQQILVGILCIAAFALSGWVGMFYGLDQSGIILLRALVVSFFLSSLKTIPSVLLERKLDFNKLVIPQIVETLGFYGVAVFLAWKGFGITSFTWGVLVRAVLGLITIYIISPWKIRFGLDRKNAKQLLRFGVPFQMNSVLALLKDDLLTIFLGKALPFAEVGYIGWAKKWAEVPLRLIMDSLIRVTFPAFSRLQHAPEVLGRAIEKTLFGLAVTIFPISTGLLFFISPIVTLIPKYSKWEPALFSFYLFIITSLVAAFTTPLTNALNAIGKIKITLWLMVFWTAATWILTVTGIHLFGYNGVAISFLILSLSVFLVVHLMKKFISFSVLPQIIIPALGALIQGMFYYFLLGTPPFEPVRLGVIGLGGAILYGVFVWLFRHREILSLVNMYKRTR